MGNIVEIIKRAALDAVEAQKPMNIIFGVVSSITPLKIAVEQKQILERDSLILTNAVKEHVVEMTVDHTTEDVIGGIADTHTHAYKGTKAFTVHNGLVAGEKVLLLRMQGGQKFVVLDRLA